MSERLSTQKSDQRLFFQNIKSISKLRWNDLAKLCNVSSRTIRDWARAKYTPPYSVCILLSKKFGIGLPKKFKTLEPYWYIKKYARRGALARQKLYGILGNTETRRMAGLISQQKRRENPKKYRELGCIVRKDLKKQLKSSTRLAELFGIILGDGGITNNQIKITLNRKSDKDYAKIVHKLLFQTFGEAPAIYKRENVLNLVLSGINLVKALEDLGLKRGNKVSNQVSIPDWILSNEDYSKDCVRGLVDTDGSVYFHRHTTKGIKYFNIGLTFTNHSAPLLNEVYAILKRNNFYPSVVKNKSIYIYNLEEIKRYFRVVGSSNPKHIKRLNFYLNQRKK